MKGKRLISAMLVAAQCLGPVAVYAAEHTPVVVPETTNTYEQRFLDLYADIKDSKNGYFDENGIPYHSVETLMIEAPDQGHESTSEAASYLLWLEAMNGKFTGDFSGVGKAWDVMEKYFIPTDQDQPGQNNYNTSKPATAAAEYSDPSQYPSQMRFDVQTGQDPLYNELKNTYGTAKVYGMHWLIDVDNFYGYGRRSDGTSKPAYINTYQRGEQESVWETIPHPSWDEFKWGGKNGFMPFFTKDSQYAKQWRYTIASDADARVIQAMYDADKWASEEGQSLDQYDAKASKMGDYLRYSLFDKYFMKVGAQGTTPGNGRDAEHYLLSWYYSWGGATDGSWCWRIGSSHAHFGYQNPFAAWVLSNDSKFIPKSATAKSDWSTSLDRQLEFYQWLQSSEGAIAGGATNSYGGFYKKYPAGTSTFYGMAYDPHPVYKDPGSNRWFGMQCWSMQRIARLYYETGDERAKQLLDKWASWADSTVRLHDDGTFEIPDQLIWSGQPDTWNGTYTGNSNLHVSVGKYGTDIGVASSLANTLTYYAAGLKKYAPEQDHEKYVTTARELLDRMWNLYRDDKGLSVTETLDECTKRFFDQKVAVPSDYTGTMKNGDKIEPGATFFSIRTNYENDPDFARLKECYESGQPFTMKYHRFWAQSEAAIANGTMAMLFPEDVTLPTVNITNPKDKSVFTWADGSEGIDVNVNATTTEGKISKVEFFADGKKFAEDTEADPQNGYEAKYVPTKDNLKSDGTKDVVLTAVAYTDKDKQNTSEKVNITVKFTDIELPKLSITSPENGAVIDYRKEQNPIEVTANADAPEGTITKVEFFANGEKIGETDGKENKVSFTPDNKGVDENGIKKIKLTATATTKDGVKAEAEPVEIEVRFKKISKPVVKITDPQNGDVIDATNGSKTIKVSADASVEDGEIQKVIIYADGQKIGSQNGDSCTAEYTTPDGHGTKEVVFTAEAVSTDDQKAESDPVKVKVKLPEAPKPDTNINVDFSSQGGDNSNTLGGRFVVTSDGSADLSKLAIRYYFTVEDPDEMEAHKDNVGLNCPQDPWYVNLASDTNVDLVKVSDTQYYMEITFDTAQTLDAGGKLELGIRANKKNWSSFDQTNDDSYNNGPVVLYNGEVVKGNMPY